METLKTDDIKVVYDIFEDETYKNLYLLKSEIKKISDYKLKVGLIAELLVRSDQYGVSVGDMYDLIEDTKSNLDGVDAFDSESQLIDCHTYYVNQLSSDWRSQLWDFFHEEGDLAQNQNFIDWIKSLSQSDIEKVKDYCLELEIYEVVTFIIDLRK